MPAQRLAATRRLGIRGGVEIVAVRRARLKVQRGPEKGKTYPLGDASVTLIGTDPDAEVVLTDDSVSFRHAELRALPEGYQLRDLGSTNGTRVGGVRVREAILDRKTMDLELGSTELRFTYQTDEVQHRLAVSDRFGSLLGGSPAMRRVFEVLGRAAATDSTVLLLGESGTGKELAAQSLHDASPRAAGPFVVVDCSALSPNLADSELFGHERGAFTGADSTHAGAFEEASGGTLFLDEIGELPLDLQTRLLRVLERREVKRVGAAHFREVNVRVVAATQRDLERAVAAGGFRADLYYRLAVVKVTLPPLRHRTEDLPLLARTILERLHPGVDPEEVLPKTLLEAFATYHWPGNVRELRNVLERAVLVGDAALPRLERPAPIAYHEARRHALDAFEQAYCRARLDESSGVMARAAGRAGISRQMFHRLVKKHGLSTGE